MRAFRPCAFAMEDLDTSKKHVATKLNLLRKPVKLIRVLKYQDAQKLNRRKLILENGCL